ncbi:MAG TPA: bi-domain-containing oxidoreductase [Desulfomonilaceae bacterium]|nr:bi-domain-containing oxidoreductase [Desulfomonilaceae bacterium]
MQQVIQNLKTGRLSVAHIPEPLVRPGHVLIENRVSVISAGTEKTAMDLARKSLLGKARQRPDQVRRVLEKLKNEGIFQTISQVREKLDEPMAMGYASAGIVLACGSGVQEFKPGQRVASNGPHAGVVCVPKHLTALIPDNVITEHAAFGVLGAIALQGVRLSRVALGETVLVIGLGLIGQLTVALLKASGIRVLATDLHASRCTLAVEKMGADLARPDLSAEAVLDATRGMGADGVLITASTKSKAPMDLAATAVRQKGRVVLVGVVGLELDRRAFYFKEAEFVVSCSYGPGRYDPAYEEGGHDYPAAYVRWTEQRNMQAVLDLMGSGTLDVSPLITHRFSIEKAEDAYQIIEADKEPHLGVLLTYPTVEDRQPVRRIDLQPPDPRAKDNVGVGFLGAGNFARMVMLPTLRKIPGLRLRSICSGGGLSARHAGEKRGFASAVTDEGEIFDDADIGMVFVLTRHDLHARQVVKALQSGKNVYVEKPLALTVEELNEIESNLLAGASRPILMVGFNRRFSPAAAKIKQFFGDVSAPLSVSVRFNAGSIPAEHWTQDDDIGGGRIIGEACHAIDLATFLIGSPPVRVFAESISGPQAPSITEDQCFITLRHADGSISNVAYLSGGDKAFPKERIEVVGGGRIGVIEDFREVALCSGGKAKRKRSWTQDKGHVQAIGAFVAAVKAGTSSPIAWHELRGVSLAAILAARSIREGLAFDIG